MHLKEYVHSFTRYYENQIDKGEEKLAAYPPGRMSCYKDKKGYMCKLLQEGQKPMYISKKDRSLAELMARKALLEAQQQDFQADLYACRQYDAAMEKHPHAVRHLMENAGMRDLLSTSMPPSDDFATKWMKETYEKCTGYPDTLIIPTLSGMMVRSKSETIFVSLLISLDIPFRYEERYIIDGQIMYPDFTLLHPKRHQVILVELFGMMDDYEYRRRTYEKIDAYIREGYFPNQRLLVFFESQKAPLDALYVKHTLEYYLLDER